MSAGRWRSPAVAALLLATVLVGAAVWWALRDRVVGADAEVGAAPAAGETARGDDAGLAFVTLLLPDGGVAVDPASVRIGLASVSADDLAAYRAWLRGGREGAGPARLEDLATVTRWLGTRATPAADGSARVGPMRLPAADRYVLQARGDDGLRFYEVEFGRDDAPALVRPRVAAGLRVRARVPGAAVLLRRVEEGDNRDDARWQSLMRRESPQALAAYDDRPLPVGAETGIAPLPPGPIEVIAMVGGLEIERRRMTLSAGRHVDFDVDPEAAALAARLPTRLSLRLVERGSGAPVRRATVQWSSSRGERDLRPDTEGRVQFDGIDPLRPLTLQLRFPPPESPSFLVDALPDWPERMPLTLDPREARIVNGRLEQTVELEPLRWLIVETPGVAIPRRPRVGDPYPVFVLQRREDGGWRDAAADHFRPVAEGLAVSLDRPGAVRVAALQAPWRIGYSGAVEVRPEIARDRTRLAFAPGRRVRLQLRAEHGPLSRVPVRLIAPLRGVPPTQMLTDADGRIVLEQANAPSLRIEAPGFRQVEVALDADEVRVTLRRDAD
jgi:hypothetical protein